MLFGRTVLLGALSLFSLAPTRVCAVYTSSGQNNTDYEYDPFMSELTTRDVYSPRITSPDSSATWVVGSKVRVTWDTSDAPAHITDPQGKVILGHLEDGTNEHLDLDHPLAEEFDIMRGHAEFMVPNVPPGDEYIIVLMGDSGNKSPMFTIN